MSHICVQRSLFCDRKQWATFQIFDADLDPESRQNVKMYNFEIVLEQ